MTNEERNKKLAEARARYGRPFITDRPMRRPVCPLKHALAASRFQHQKRPFNV
jgi:hypothetical protein